MTEETLERSDLTESPENGLDDRAHAPKSQADSALMSQEVAKDDGPASTEQRSEDLAASDVDSDWTPQHRRNTSDQIRFADKYTRFVKMMKLFLPIAAGGIFILLVLYSGFSEQSDNVTIRFENMDKLEDDLVMLNPIMTGFDKKNNPFKFTADRAIQDVENTDLVSLESVKGELLGSDYTITGESRPSDKLDVTSNAGLMNSAAQTLRLNGNVILKSGTDYVFYTEEANIDFEESLVVGDKPIRGESSMGEVESEEFAVWDNGNVIRFSGNVKTKIYGSEEKQ